MKEPKPEIHFNEKKNGDLPKNRKLSGKWYPRFLLNFGRL
jgi:hypothetical protein